MLEKSKYFYYFSKDSVIHSLKKTPLQIEYSQKLAQINSKVFEILKEKFLQVKDNQIKNVEEYFIRKSGKKELYEKVSNLKKNLVLFHIFEFNKSKEDDLGNFIKQQSEEIENKIKLFEERIETSKKRKFLSSNKKFEETIDDENQFETSFNLYKKLSKQNDFKEHYQKKMLSVSCLYFKNSIDTIKLLLKEDFKNNIEYCLTIWGENILNMKENIGFVEDLFNNQNLNFRNTMIDFKNWVDIQIEIIKSSPKFAERTSFSKNLNKLKEIANSGLGAVEKFEYFDFEQFN